MITVEVARSSMLLMRRVTGESSIRRPSGVARVRRVLFDEPLNHEETRRDLLRETEQLRSEMRRRWNFDFETETPLPGWYEWQRAAAETVHPAYDLRHIERVAGPTSSSSTVVSSGSASVTSDCRLSAKNRELESPLVKIPVKATAASSTKAKSTCIQKKVTEFMTQRKRQQVKSSNSPPRSPKNKVRKTTRT